MKGEKKRGENCLIKSDESEIKRRTNCVTHLHHEWMVRMMMVYGDDDMVHG